MTSVCAATKPRVVVLADDLTGAAGTAAMFADRGAACGVALGLGAAAARGPAPAPDVLAIDLGTRDRPAPDPLCIHEAVSGAFTTGAGLVAKRLDSTLRGHVRAEIAAALEAAPPGAIALVSPAFPALGRTVRDGRLYVHRQPDVDVMAAMGQGVALGRLDLATVRRGPVATSSALSSLVAAGVRVIICDAERDDDLRVLAAGTADLPVLPCDPGPLTLALAGARGLLPERRGEPPTLPAVQAPVLAVFGSRTPLTRRQVAHAEQAGLLSLVPVRGRPVLDARAVAGVLSRERRVAALLPAFAPCAEQEAAQALARAAVVALRQARAGGLYLTGGHTARTVLDALGVSRLTVLGSVLPLAARSVATSGSHAGLAVVTKGGLVGGEDAASRCLRALGVDGAAP